MDDKTLPLSGHLAELRRVAIMSLAAVLVGFSICVGFSDYLDYALRIPIQNLLSQDTKPVYLGVFEPIFYRLKLGLIGGIFLASPIIFWQIWWFVSPGLTKKERHLAFPFVLVACAFFFGGAAFAYFFVLPITIAFSLGQMTHETQLVLALQSYLTNACSLIFAFGLVFETPMLVVLISYVGLITTKKLIRYRKYVILLCFIIGAILTPTPDPFNQVAVALPMYLLFELGVLGARVVEAKA